jgi:hypothetical protein
MTTMLLRGQAQLKGVVADSASRQVLPFATVKPASGKTTAITEMNGGFQLLIPADATAITVSYTGYMGKTLSLDRFRNGDTVWLARRGNMLGEVVVRPNIDKVKRIVNRAIRNKPLHNPEGYEAYQCNMYYKMYASPEWSLQKRDSAQKKSQRSDSLTTGRNKKERGKADTTGFTLANGNLYLVFSEAYSKRSFRRPQLQELILASRFSGFKKTYFPNLVTNVLPFHIYNDIIVINSGEYLSPLAKGWQQRYVFRLEDEVIDGADTTFMLSYRPKRMGSFEGLEGTVYISTRGYAVSHFSGSNTSLATGRQMKFDQQYRWVDGRWFPAEMNYRLSFQQIRKDMPGFVLNGHAVVSNLAYQQDGQLPVSKAYPVKIADSVDLRSAAYWESLRSEPLSVKEGNTYRLIDSLFRKKKIEKLMTALGSMPVGRLSFGPLDVNPAQVVAFNEYEGTRLGMGLYTNDRVSKYFSVGGWAGYGFRDKAWKYGGSATLFPNANKDHWLQVYYNDAYQNAGVLNIHPELGQSFIQNWLLRQPDRIRQYGALFHTQRGFWQIELGAQKQDIANLYPSAFAWQGKNIRRFDAQEASVGLRYAHGEKRVPVFGYYLPDNTVANRYPVLYAKLTVGTASAEGYRADYLRTLAGLTYQRRFKRWGTDAWQVTAGMLATHDNSPLPRSFLMASNGLRREGGNIYLPGGYMTMFQNEFYGSRFVSVHYLHSFNKYLWKSKMSQPFVSIGHNLLYSDMDQKHRRANPDLRTASSGYHESGLILNQLLQWGFFNSFTMYFNVGAFYHWTPRFDWEKQGVLVTGIGLRF